jgi:hypothetical protein
MGKAERSTVKRVDGFWIFSSKIVTEHGVVFELEFPLVLLGRKQER